MYAKIIKFVVGNRAKREVSRSWAEEEGHLPAVLTFGWIEEDVRLRDSPMRPSGALI